MDGVVSVDPGGTLQFYAEVEGGYDQSVIWSISTQGIAEGTTINADGLLSVDAGETKSPIEIKAVSTADADKWGTMSVAVTGIPTVIGVLVTAADDADGVERGGTLQLSALVVGAFSPDQSVNWSISTQGIAEGTGISDDGLLSVDAEETKSPIEVKAVSTANTGKSGSMAITVTGISTVSGVTVTTAGDASSVYQGRTLQFSATVEGDYSPAQSVNWSITTEGIAGGTTISDDGLLSVAAGENKTPIEVKAVSTADTSKWGTKSITVTVETDINNVDFGADATIQPEITVTSLEQWTAAISTISTGGNDKNYIINVNAEVTGLTGVTAATFGTTTTGIKVSLRGTGSLELGSTGNLIRIQKEQKLILRDITLKGKTGNNLAVVHMLGATAAGTIQPVFIMESGEISGNTSSATGGGVYNIRGTFTMNGGEISGNTAAAGAGVYNNTNGTFTMSGGEISNNNATETNGNGGGVLCNTGATFTMSGGEISNNNATGSGSTGGGVCGTGVTFTMSGGVISNNSVISGGGGVIINTGTFTMSGGTISNNKATVATGNGGGVYIMANTVFTMEGGTISGNTAANAGGVGTSTSTFIMTGGTISNNIANGTTGVGGGVNNGGNMFIMSGGTISGNTATTSGGGVSGAGTFIKTAGTVYGSGEGDNSNTATGGDTKGHAVYVSATKYRDTTAGTGVGLNSATSGGWITN